MAPLGGVVLVAQRARPADKRAHQLPGLVPREAGRVDAEVEVSPDHQAGHRASDLNHASGAAENVVQRVALDERSRLGL